jgi:acyl-homoserine lactone acylase PvdQ
MSVHECPRTPKNPSGASFHGENTGSIPVGVTIVKPNAPALRALWAVPATDYAADPRAQAIAAAAARLDELRENWLNPADLVVREPEVVPGYPDRILPKDGNAAKELQKRTLTNLYNARSQWLANAHADLDAAVADAYGWGDDWRAGLLDDDEILARLFLLNQTRSADQVKQTLQ